MAGVVWTYQIDNEILANHPMPSKPEPSIAVIGCGHWGKNLVRNMHGLGAVASVHDRDPETEAAIASEYGVPGRQWPEILDDDAIRGVVIAAPAAAHHALVHEALLADKHVFVEKPLALRIEQAEELRALADGRQRVLMVGHLLQYHPAFLKLKEICSSGELGRLRYIYSNRLNLGKFRTEENTLWSFAPHDISMILALLGDGLETVLATGHAYLHKAIADVTTTHLSFASGQAAHIYVSWLHPFKEHRLVVIGEQGMAVFDDGEDWPSKIRKYPHRIDWRDGLPQPQKAQAVSVPVEADEPLLLECQHFLDCIETGATPRTDAGEGWRVLRVLDAAQRSMETGRTVDMRERSPAGNDVFIHQTSCVDQSSEIGSGTKIWHFSHVMKNSKIGRNCVIGQNVAVGPAAVIGDGCKIQNNVSVYQGVTLEKGVFCGPSMVFTNVVNPRAEISRKDKFKPILVRRGATIGANATILCGNTIGRYAFIGAGAVVTKDVPDHALVLGNPARHVGHICTCGVRLPDGEWEEADCPACGRSFRQSGGVPEAR